MAPSEGNKRLLGMYDRASQDLGLGAVQGVDFFLRALHLFLHGLRLLHEAGELSFVEHGVSFVMGERMR